RSPKAQSDRTGRRSEKDIVRARLLSTERAKVQTPSCRGYAEKVLLVAANYGSSWREARKSCHSDTRCARLTLHGVDTRRSEAHFDVSGLTQRIQPVTSGLFHLLELDALLQLGQHVFELR